MAGVTLLARHKKPITAGLGHRLGLGHRPFLGGIIPLGPAGVIPWSNCSSWKYFSVELKYFICTVGIIPQKDRIRHCTALHCTALGAIMEK